MSEITATAGINPCIKVPRFKANDHDPDRLKLALANRHRRAALRSQNIAKAEGGKRLIYESLTFI